MSAWPIRFLNATGDVLPPFSLVALTSAARVEEELIYDATLPTASGEEALYVTSPQEVADAAYGWCRTVSDPPFWVRYDGTVAAGDVVGPVDGEYHVNTEGEGIVVLHVDTDNEIARCDILRGGASGDGGFPPGTGGCDCGHCLEGTSIVDANPDTGCCSSHLRFSLINPWLACEDHDLTLEYIGNDTWLTEAFDGPDCDGNVNEYRWKLIVDVTDQSTLSLVVDTDAGCDIPCIVYARLGFRCKCDNDFSLDPYGRWSGVDRRDISCHACIKPISAFDRDATCNACLEENGLPMAWSLVFEGTSDDETDPEIDCNDDCEQVIDATHYLFAESECYWQTETYPLTTQCLHGCIRYMALSASYGGGQRIFELRVYFAYDPGACGGGLGSGGFLLYRGEYFDGQTDCSVNLELEIDFPGDISDELGCLGYMVNSVTLTPLVLVPFPTESGVCTECTTDDVPADPDPGGCCYLGVCYDNWDETLCNGFGGNWDAEGCGDCEGAGVCCIDGGCMTGLYRALCENGLGGTFVLGGECGGDPDPCVATGACCRSDLSCDVTTEDDCVGPLEYFHGVGTDCGDIDCGDVACCESGEYFSCSVDTATCLGTSGTVVYPVPGGCSAGNPC